MSSRGWWMWVLLTALWSSSAVAWGQESLFTEEVRWSRLTPEQQRRYETYRALRSTGRIRLVDFVEDPIRARVLRLDLFPGSSYDAVVEKVEHHLDGGYTWEGRILGRPGRVILVVQHREITGWIWASRGSEGEDFFSISPLGGRTHILRETVQTWFDSVYPGCTEPTATAPQPTIAANEPAAPKLEKAPVATDPEEAPSAASFGCMVNVLVAFTPAAQAAHGNIPALAQLAVNQTNSTYANSKATGAMLNLVGTLGVNYVESGTWTGDRLTDLVRLQTSGDNWIDQVHPARADLGADIVVLFVNDLEDLGVFGQAAQILATQGTAFAVVDWEAAVDNLTFAHELGHLQGARHHWEVDSNTTPYSHGHGSCRGWPYKYRTVMGTPHCTHPRVPYWSNPDVTYNNRKTGDSSHRNNARVLRETACTIGSLTGPALMGWNHRWGNGGSDLIHWWYLNPDDRYVAGDFDGDGIDELLAVNPNGFAHLMEFNGSWSTRWANVGNGIIHSWKISAADRFVAGDFVAGNGRDELLAVNSSSGYAHLITYDGTAWTTPWANWGSGIIDSWKLSPADRYVAGDLVPGNGRDELLAVNPSSGYAHLMTFNGSAWSTSWANWGSGIVDSWKLSPADRYVVGDFVSGSGGDELLAVNPSSGYAHLLAYGGTTWTTPWANWGNGAMHWWLIGGADRYIAGDFIAGNGRDEVLAVALNNGWSQILSYTGSTWQTIWGNSGAGNIGWWFISSWDSYLSGDFVPGDQRDELLSIQPLNGWAHVHSRQ